MYILQFIQDDNTCQCTIGFSWDGKPFWPEIRIYASQKSFNIHSTDKMWKSIIKQYYKYVLHIYNIFTHNCLVSSWGPGFKKDIMLVCSFEAWKLLASKKNPPVAARSHPRWHPHREHDVHDWFPTHTTTLDFPSSSFDQHCRSVIMSCSVKLCDISMDCHDSASITMWAYPSTSHKSRSDWSLPMTCGLGILTNHCHGWFNGCYGWWTMVQTCSNGLILNETMQGCTASWYICRNGPITLEITRLLAVNTSHLVEEQLAVAGMFSTS